MRTANAVDNPISWRPVDVSFMYRLNEGSQRIEEMGSNPLETSLQRMHTALDLLEAAVERRIRYDARSADAHEELALMQDDRSRLAVELDAAANRNSALLAANVVASERLARARATIEDVLRRAQAVAAPE